MANPPQLLLVSRKTPIQVHIQSSVLTNTLDGATAGAATDDEPSTQPENHRINNRVIEAFGKRFVYYQDTIRERDEGGTANYGTVYTFVNGTVPALEPNSGLHIVHVNGKEVLALIYYDSTARIFYGVWTNDGITWNEQNIDSGWTGGNGAVATGNARAFQSSIVWNIELDITGAGDEILLIYDFTLGTATRITKSGSGVAPNSACAHDLTIHKNQIYMNTWRNASPPRSYVNRLDGTAWTNVYDSSAHTGDQDNSVQRTLFTDPSTGDLIAISIYDNGGQGLYAIQIIGANTKSGLTDASPGSDIVDLTLTVLPVELRTPNDSSGTWPDREALIEHFVDNVTTPGTPVVFVLVAQTASGNSNITTTGNHKWYQWNGVGSPMTFVGTAAATGADWAISVSSRGGGERIPTDGNARLVWDGATVLSHGSVTNGPFVVGEAVTSAGTGVGVIETLYATSMAINVTSGVFLDTELITGGGSSATATLNADSADLHSPTEIAGGFTKVYFRSRGSAAATGMEVYYDSDSETPVTQMNLIASTVTIEAGSPATTPTNTGTTISNITPDGGSAIYSIQLDTNGAGILSGQGYSLLAVPV